MKEIWKPVVGYEGKYEVSNFGRVKSLNYRNTGTKKLLTLQLRSDGYLQVKLSHRGKQYKPKVHQLVAQAFTPKNRPTDEVNHIDKNRSNNLASNLEWISRKENVRYSHSKKVIAQDSHGNVVHEYPSATEAAVDGFRQQSISRCCLGQRNTYKGLYWSFL